MPKKESSNPLLAKLKATSKIKESAVLTDSIYFQDKEDVATLVPMMNVALSGDLEKGFVPGLTTIAGPSKHFKTSFGLVMASAYLRKYEDAVLLFYDSEFGSPQSYFETFGIDTDRVLHTPIKDIEELKFDIVNQLKNIGRNDHVIVMIDSVGNLASKKELEDALNEKSVADMTRAKQLKSVFRMVTPYLTMHNIPMIVINHTYKTQDLFPKDVVGGGTGVYYSSDTVWIVGRQQNKKGTDLLGYRFIINVDKSRFVKEKSKIPIQVSFDRGVEQYSGLLDIALLGGFVVKPKNGWYQRKGTEKMVREKDTLKAEFWTELLQDEEFKTFMRKSYQLTGNGSIIDFEEGVEEFVIDDNG